MTLNTRMSRIPLQLHDASAPAELPRTLPTLSSPASSASSATTLADRASTSQRSRIRRHPERSAPEIAEEILRAGRVAHVAFAIDGQPYLSPMTYHYEDGVVYLHGAPASRLQKTLRAGSPVAIEVMLLDGLVASREAKKHSMNYRSVVVYGTAEPVTDMGRKRAIMDVMTARYFPGRTVGHDYEAATTGQMRAMDLMAVAIEELSAKTRSGPPKGDRDALDDAPGSAFVVALPGLDS